MDTSETRSVHLTVDGKPLQGELTVPSQPVGLVQLVTGAAGAAQASYENKLTGQMHAQQLATLVVDLVSPEESHDRSVRSNVSLLHRRLGSQREWLADQGSVADLPTLLCGVDTGAAVAVEYLVSGQQEVEAAAFLNGRLDLVESAVSEVDVPVLFFVDTSHEYLVEANRDAYRHAPVSVTEKNFLHGVDEDAVVPVSRWLRSSVDTDDPSVQEDERTDSLHSAF